MAQHAGLAAGRWYTLSLVEQLANVGSEVERAFRAREENRSDRLERARDRALELFDLTANDDRWRGPRRREILRAREEFCRLLLSGRFSTTDASGFRSYFRQFGMAARRQLHRA